ncbi:unnamed protein product [Acanthoscelides obtectus]|uniref:Uncharacterized protein n=1 Tax=Acanthoscelides obtectus TaxID=200917 RepID=A0A9P0P6Y0_ACAOB|nr:unnamed protein product [Acanthoscelides obtectus]CAK1669282.1 hypothetical protein AOBTE_LOCUS26923 [Acanthoscelides obtectus]
MGLRYAVYLLIMWEPAKQPQPHDAAPRVEEPHLNAAQLVPATPHVREHRRTTDRHHEASRRVKKPPGANEDHNHDANYTAMYLIHKTLFVILLI